MLLARPPTSTTSCWAISGAPAAQKRSRPPLRLGRCRPGHPLACLPLVVPLEAGPPGTSVQRAPVSAAGPHPPGGRTAPRPGVPGGFGLAEPRGQVLETTLLPAPRRPWLGPAGMSSRSVMGWCCSHRGVRSLPTQVCVDNTRALETVCTQTCSPSADTQTSYQRFLFIFNQDSPPTLFSYKFACCKQVCKDPFFGEIRVRMNTLRQGDASILRCFGANSFSHCQPLAMP